MYDHDISDHPAPWIYWFCNQDKNEFACEIELSYIEDNFNLYGLKNMVECYE